MRALLYDFRHGLRLLRRYPSTSLLANVTDERIAELVDANLGALEAILRWNHSRGIRAFRLTSNLIPFGSHPANTHPWWEIFADRDAVSDLSPPRHLHRPRSRAESR